MKRYSIRKRALFPKCIRHFKELRGISVGGCIKKTPLAGQMAHAHCNHCCRPVGWICLKYKYQLKEKLTLLHEVAHLIANTSTDVPDHGKKWRDTVVAIGGTYGSYLSYNKNLEYLDFSPKRRKKQC